MFEWTRRSWENASTWLWSLHWPHHQNCEWGLTNHWLTLFTSATHTHKKKVDLFPNSADYNGLSRQREWPSAKGKALNNRSDFERGVLCSPQLSIRVMYVRLFLPSAAEKTARTNWRLSRLASDYIYSLQFQTSSIISFAQSASLWVVDKCVREVKYIY